MRNAMFGIVREIQSMTGEVISSTSGIRLHSSHLCSYPRHWLLSALVKEESLCSGQYRAVELVKVLMRREYPLSPKADNVTNPAL